MSISTRQNRWTRQNFSRRSGSIALFLLLAIVLVAGIGAVAWFTLSGSTEDKTADVLTFATRRGPYEHIVLEQGQVESANSVEIRCQVKSTSPGGTEIKWVIPEGTRVVKGQKLVELNSADLDDALVQQQIVCNTSEALVVQAENTLRAAEIARKEYLEGTFKTEEQTLMSELFVAEENLRRAQRNYKSTERLAAKGIVTALQLDGDGFAVDKSRKELESAQTKLDVLRKYTKEKMLKQFDSDITTAEAKWESEKESHRLELSKLADIRKQIELCTIVAPDDGQVVYANVYSRRGGSAEFVVEEGASVREGQVIIRLPDSAKMQVKATINESRISLVKAGMPVAVTLDAVKGKTLKGVVTKVNQYAEPGGWSSGNIKEYAAYIEILDTLPQIRSGMNAEVRIYVERKEDALQVPVQALYETKGHYFCLVKNEDGWETREIKVGSSNDTFMTIESGLETGEAVALNPRGYPELLEIPAIEKEPIALQIANRSEFGGTSNVSSPPDRPASGSEESEPTSASDGPPRGPFDPAAAFARIDQNGDGIASSDEISSLPAGFQDRVKAADTDGDGNVDRDEFMANMRGRPAGGEPTATGGGQ